MTTYERMQRDLRLARILDHVILLTGLGIACAAAWWVVQFVFTGRIF